MPPLPATAPQPMVKPDPLGVRNGREVMVIIPRASEEYGPISHSFIVDADNPYKDPESYTAEDVSWRWSLGGQKGVSKKIILSVVKIISYQNYQN